MCTSVKSAKGFFERPDPRCIKYDYIGPPDKDSNIRPFVRCIRSNESNVERKLRMKLLDVEEWNHSFWSRHNKRFYDVSKTICRNRFVLRLWSSFRDISPQSFYFPERACFCKSNVGFRSFCLWERGERKLSFDTEKGGNFFCKSYFSSLIKSIMNAMGRRFYLITRS